MASAVVKTVQEILQNVEDDANDAIRVNAVAGGLESNTILVGGVSTTVKFAVIDNATAGDNTIVAAVASKKIRVLNVMLISAGTVAVRFESGASGTALTGQMQLTAQIGFAPGFDPTGHFETAVGALLNLELSGAISVDGWIKYVEV